MVRFWICSSVLKNLCGSSNFRRCVALTFALTVSKLLACLVTSLCIVLNYGVTLIPLVISRYGNILSSASQIWEVYRFL
jgi:hypothetical protein